MPLDLTKTAGRAIARSALGRGLKRVAGNLAGLIDGGLSGNGSDFGDIANRGSQRTNMLAFPLDILADPGPDGGQGNHGHYIQFFINTQESATLKFAMSREQFEILDGVRQENRRRQITKDSDGVIFDPNKGVDISPSVGPKQVLAEQVHAHLGFFNENSEAFKTLKNEGGGAARKAAGVVEPSGFSKDHNTGKRIKTDKKHSQTISIDRPPTKRLDTVIAMYMPADIKVSYKANYTDTSIGSLTQSASQVVGEYLNTGAVSGETIQKNAKDVFTAVGIDGIVNLLSNVPSLGGAREAIEMSMGQVIVDRMEMAFKGIDKRKFSYTFKMIPRSEKEAEEVKKIISMFKAHMLPEMVDGNDRGRLMTYPSTFDIQYMYKEQENQYLNKVSTCYLESMDVDYGGDRYYTHEFINNVGAPPTETSITLQFGEIDLVTRERAVNGF
jgi:hypothetical protein